MHTPSSFSHPCHTIPPPVLLTRPPSLQASSLFFRSSTRGRMDLAERVCEPIHCLASHSAGRKCWACHFGGRFSMMIPVRGPNHCFTVSSLVGRCKVGPPTRRPESATAQTCHFAAESHALLCNHEVPNLDS